MLQNFPTFSKLNIHQQGEINNLVSMFCPYSDFNFTSLFCWDDGSTEVCYLNGNLVVKMSDYISDKPIYSILGQNSIDNSLLTLLELTPSIELVPETVIESIENPELFQCIEDRDQFDYIYLLDKQAQMPGGDFKVKRNKISNFIRNNTDKLTVQKIDFKKGTIKTGIEDVMSLWSTERNAESSDVEREFTAIEKLFKYGSGFNLVGIEVYLNGKCVAFSINEPVQRDYAICHFQKSILSFDHVDVFLSNLVSKELKHFGCKYINWEQDLGIPGLRRLKESYKPDFYLKKYIVKKV